MRKYDKRVPSKAILNVKLNLTSSGVLSGEKLNWLGSKITAPLKTSVETYGHFKGSSSKALSVTFKRRIKAIHEEGLCHVNSPIKGIRWRN